MANVATVNPLPSKVPCTGCSFVPTCAASGRMCRAFEAFVRGGRTEWRKLPRVPTAATVGASRAFKLAQRKRRERERRARLV